MRENDQRRLYIKVTTKKALLLSKYATRSSLEGKRIPTTNMAHINHIDYVILYMDGGSKKYIFIILVTYFCINILSYI